MPVYLRDLRAVVLASTLAAFALSFGSTAMAQDTTATPSVAESEIAVGTNYSRDVFGDWDLRCVKVAEGNDPCTLFQLLRDKDGNEVAEISIVAITDGSPVVAGATVITPLETLLPRQATMAFGAGEGEAKRYPFTFCNPVGCFARMGMEAKDLELMKKGAQSVLTIFALATPDLPVELPVSLKGFTNGFDAVKAANAK